MVLEVEVMWLTSWLQSWCTGFADIDHKIWLSECKLHRRHNSGMMDVWQDSRRNGGRDVGWISQDLHLSVSKDMTDGTRLAYQTARNSWLCNSEEEL